MPTCRYWVPEHKVNPEGQQVKILWLVHTSFKLVDNVPQVCMSSRQTHWKRSRMIMTKSRCSLELYIGCPQIAHPLFTTAQTSGATLRHPNLTLGSYISSSLPGSLDALIFIFSLRNQHVHFLGGKPGGYSEQHPQNSTMASEEMFIVKSFKSDPLPGALCRLEASKLKWCQA